MALPQQQSREMRSGLVAGNWKMNGSRDTAVDLLSAIASGVSQLTGVEIVVCPPFVLISQAIAALADSGVAVGGQDLDPNMPGAFTGLIPLSLDPLLCESRAGVGAYGSGGCPSALWS